MIRAASQTTVDPLPEPPEHLGPEATYYWCRTVETFDLELHQLRLLRMLCECWDTMQRARAVISELGETYLDRWEAPKSRPEVAILRDARSQYLKLHGELGLDYPPPHGARVFRPAEDD